MEINNLEAPGVSSLLKKTKYNTVTVYNNYQTHLNCSFQENMAVMKGRLMEASRRQSALAVLYVEQDREEVDMEFEVDIGTQAKPKARTTELRTNHLNKKRFVCIILHDIGRHFWVKLTLFSGLQNYLIINIK